MVLKGGYFGKQIKNTFEVVKCGAGEGLGRSVGMIVCELKKTYKESRGRDISYKQCKKGRLTGFVTSCIGTISLETSLKERKRERCK
jgi:hypothetical protein